MNINLWRRSLVGSLSNFHRPGPRPDIFIFAMPRSGATFLMEMLGAQPGVKLYNQPIDAGDPARERELGARTWEELTLMSDREERYLRFFDRLRHNRVKELNAPFYRRNHRFFTNRNVFKINGGAEGMIPWFASTFAGMVVILIRHPIPVALSLRGPARVHDLLKHPVLRQLFSASEIMFAQDVVASGSAFERGLINWVLQTGAMLRPGVEPDWVVISYEDLAMHPKESFDYLRANLDLDPIADLMSLAARPSGSTNLSTQETQRFLAEHGPDDDRLHLINKWTVRASPDEVRRCFEICRYFKFDLYEEENLFPVAPYRVPAFRRAEAIDIDKTTVVRA
jgi:hypothetical protein